ncbi:MAG TPA: hypothetical protein PLE13_09615 [Solirubrobacterales bacterium]|nr:hypothetical protein [Solirubrobacterales bacterium]
MSRSATAQRQDRNRARTISAMATASPSEGRSTSSGLDGAS